jgi:hypothetical protein
MTEFFMFHAHVSCGKYLKEKGERKEEDGSNLCALIALAQCGKTRTSAQHTEELSLCAMYTHLQEMLKERGGGATCPLQGGKYESLCQFASRYDCILCVHGGRT